MFKVCVVFFIAIQIGATIDPADVKFFLYNSKFGDTPVELQSFGTYAYVIDPTKTVKMLCHGFMDGANSYWVAPTKESYMKKDDMNVISVDWSKHAYGAYSGTAQKAPEVGVVIARLVMEMHEYMGIPYANFHLIGHSLGAHIFGFAGKQILEATGERVGRITGLDPAGPAFNGNSINHRLSMDDALFVDAIHTDTFLLGYKKSLAHVDFWPNGGTTQNGCSLLSNCAHCRAPIYFYESIASLDFPAWECDSIKSFNSGKCVNNRKIYMGDNCNVTARGDFYLNTNKKSPFGIPA